MAKDGDFAAAATAAAAADAATMAATAATVAARTSPDTGDSLQAAEIGREAIRRDAAATADGAAGVTASASPDRLEAASASENTPLLSGPNPPNSASEESEDDVLAGRVKTTWQREASLLVRYTTPLIGSQLLGYTFLLTPVLALGHLGTVELGAMSLGAMTANITGYTVIQSLATALDTLCAQAYGAGRKQLVGLQLQRMLAFLTLILIPISAFWIASPWILHQILPNAETAFLAGTYLRISVLGMPGLAAAECGRRYLQAQGIFAPNFYARLIIAPVNILLVWLFVWQLQWGFVGAPIASVAVNWLQPLLLFAYNVLFVDKQCWPGFTGRRAFENWGPMVRLAFSGFLMIEAETIALEVITLLSSYLGTTALAAEAILTMTASFAWQIAFPLSIAMSTRIANLIGAAIPEAARTNAKVGMSMSLVIALVNFILIVVFQNYVPRIFSSDPAVCELAAMVLPLTAALALFDSIATNLNGILRGIGRQKVGGYVNLVCYYVIGIPISVGTAFRAGWGLSGLQVGITIALVAVAAVESTFIYRVSWDKSVEDAQRRNEAG